MKSIGMIGGLMIIFSCYSFAQSPGYSSEFGFKSDNDAYLAYGQDQYYTNGLFISFRHAMDQHGTGKALKKIWEAEIGQRMYNAQSGYVPDIRYVDRPFAAYLYGGGRMNWFFDHEQILQASLQTGLIGPAALGRQAQELLHSIAGFYQINGWQYQVNNEFEVNSSLSYTRLLCRSKAGRTDLSFEGCANAGTTFTGAGAGLLLRLGKSNSLLHSASANSRITHSVTDSTAAREFFFHMKPSFYLAAYDGTVEGGLFLDNKGPVTYGVKPLVFSQEAGITYANNRWTFDLSVIFKTREIQSSARLHQYGSLSAFYRFN